MRVAFLLLICLPAFPRFVMADGAIQAALANQANQQLMLLNRLSSIQHPKAATNDLQKITLAEIMTALDQGYSSQEIFDRAKKTNDPRLPQLNVLGGYHVHPNVTAYLSPMSSNVVAAQTAPTPESPADVKVRMENEARMKEPVRSLPEGNELQEMKRIYEQMQRMETKVRSKVLREGP